MSQQEEQSSSQDLQKAFTIVAGDTKGCLSRDGLKKAIQIVGLNPTDKDIADMLSAAGNDGQVNFEQFCTMVKTIPKPEEEEKEFLDAFKVFDKNGNGYIEANELQYALTNVGEKLTIEECQEMIKEADLNGDGRIDYEEFAAMMKRKS